MTYGENATLTCAVFLGGSQSYDIQLVVPMESTSLTRGTLTNETGLLLLTFSATAEDIGTYQCTATGLSPADDDLTVGKV